MKSDRMFGILCILLERENVTVRELAGYFEVSTRTIHRDLLDLSASGFPVVTRQGVGGGVSLLPNFRYNKSALSEDDMKVILAGIEGLATIDDSARMKTLLAKLRFSDGNRLLLENDIILDFTSWNQNSSFLSRIGMLRKAIAGHFIVEMGYCSPSGTVTRRVEPYKLIFKQETWYLLAFCLLRQEFRMFRLSRITDLEVSDSVFDERSDYEIPSMESHFVNDGGQAVTVKMDRSLEFLAIDFFGRENLVYQENDIVVTFLTGRPEWVLSTFSGFGNKAEILAPDSLRQEMKHYLEQMAALY